MKKVIIVFSVLVYCQYGWAAWSKPGPRVYVVTPAPASSKIQIDEARSAPFYYHNWMRRMDSPNVTTTTTAPKVKTPDLIFAEFETDHTKNIRKLLEKERIDSSTTTTYTPINVPDEVESEESKESSRLPLDTKPAEKDMNDYFAIYNNMYKDPNNLPVPVYLPSTTPTTTTKSTEAPPVNNVENIWHIIDSEKQNQPQWDEVPISQDKPDDKEAQLPTTKQINEEGVGANMDDYFALPGFGTNPGIGGENESRAIRTEPNMRFPYVNLKPFQMKKPLMNSYNSKKGNNMLTNLDKFVDLKDPVRGEAQDVMPSAARRQPVDRYNPAQPYLPPPPSYGSNSKQSPMKAVANLVPPPPPPVPKVTADDFPAPTSYESFPPYYGSGSFSGPPSPSMPSKPMSFPQPSADSGDDSGPPGDDSDNPPGMGYDYQPPAPPSSSFLPTVPPMKMTPKGYSYERPPMQSPPMEMDQKPYGYEYDKPEAPVPDKPIYGYHYSKPEPAPPAIDHPPMSYGPHESGDYPDLIFDGHHGGKGGDMKGGDMKNGGGMKDGSDDMGMVPPPPPPDMKPDMGAPPMDDSGFPHDFPSDFKYSHDFDDHDFYHHHHHHPTTTTTTTTTEMPRVNRYSYYYLGKKLYYLPLYFSVYFIIYVGALIIKAVLRHKIVYPNSFRPNDDTASFFSKRSVEDSWDLSNEKLHEITGKVTHALTTAATKYMSKKQEEID